MHEYDTVVMFHMKMQMCTEYEPMFQYDKCVCIFFVLKLSVMLSFKAIRLLT